QAPAEAASPGHGDDRRPGAADHGGGDRPHPAGHRRAPGQPRSGGGRPAPGPQRRPRPLGPVGRRPDRGDGLRRPGRRPRRLGPPVPPPPPLLPGMTLLDAPAAGPTPAAGPGPGGGPATIRITAHHSRFEPDRISVGPNSTVRFVVHNADPIDHEFIIGPPE